MALQISDQITNDKFSVSVSGNWIWIEEEQTFANVNQIGTSDHKCP
jgi:hypothetical protein